MPDKKISQLGAVTPTTDDVIALVDQADLTVTKKATLASLPVSNATNTALGTKADSSTVSALDSRVSAVEGKTANITPGTSGSFTTGAFAGTISIGNSSRGIKVGGNALTGNTIEGKDGNALNYAGSEIANKDYVDAKTWTVSDITDFAESVEDTIGTKVVAGTNVTVTYNDTTGETTISSTGGGGGAVDSVNGQTGVVVLDTGDIAEVTDKKYVTDAEKTKLSNLSGTNTGDQTSIVGITGTLTEFNNALIGADFATGGGTATWVNTGDQTISLTGDVTGSGTGTFAATLSNTGVGAGTYTNANVTVDAKGRVTTITSGSSGSGGVVSVTNEVPTGTVNGSNTVFTISNSATNNEIVVTINGLKQKETTDYTLSGTTLTFVTAPFTGALLEVFYVNSTSSAGYAVQTKSANYTLVNTDYVILADTTSNNVTLTLPTAVGQSWRTFVLKKTSYNYSMIIATTSSQTIDGDLTQTVTAGSKAAITVHSDGSNWYII